MQHEGPSLHHVAHGVSNCGTWAPEPIGFVAQRDVGPQFPNEGSNSCPLHCKADSYPLDHQ